MTSAYDPKLDRKLEQAVWVAYSLFEQGKTTGSFANMSFRHKNKIYITASGSCFGTMKKEDFVCMDMDGIPFRRKKQ